MNKIKDVDIVDLVNNYINKEKRQDMKTELIFINSQPIFVNLYSTNSCRFFQI